MRRTLRAGLAGLLLQAGPVLAQAPAEAPAAAPAARPWTFEVSAWAYFPGESRDYLNLNLSADRGPLHFEGRYNYEAVDSGSLWAGWTFGAEGDLTVAVTPIVGVVFGSVAGVAPGYNLSVGWQALSLFSSGEYVFSTNGAEDSFFFNWSELTVAPVPWLRLGIAAQRTRAYASERDLQRGLIVGISFRRLKGTVYVLNPDLAKPTVIVAAAVPF